MSFPGSYDGGGIRGPPLYNPAMGRGLPPRPGQDDEFDTYCAIQFGDVDQEVTDMTELRQAAWATWKITAPSGLGGPSSSRQDDEDEELARALALSAEEHRQKRPRRHSVIVIDDSDDESAADEQLARAVAASAEEEQQRAVKRQRREETPEDERRLLAEALAASLAHETPQPDSVHEVSDDDADVAAANAAFQASRQAFREEELRRREGISGKTSANPTPVPSPPQPASQPAIESRAPTLDLKSLIGDRVQLEKERLARQQARQAGTATASSSVRTAPTPIERSNRGSTGFGRPVAVPGPSKIHSLSSIGNGSSSSSSASKHTQKRINMDEYEFRPTEHPLQSAGPFPKDGAGEFYPDGELRHVALTAVPPTTERTFSPQDMIGTKSEIALIVMSSFVIDDEWLETILPSATSVPTIMIRPPPKEKYWDFNGKVLAMETGEVVCHPKMVTAWGSAHMKFAWIFYKTGRLRVAISTANMVPYDWDFIENTVFIQDFLPNSPSSTSTSRMGDDFRQSFVKLFAHLNVHRGLKQLKASHPAGKLVNLDHTDDFTSTTSWDWSRVRVRLVMSVPGTYTGSREMDEWGLCRLGKVLDEEGWRASKGEVSKTEYQGSSLGQYSLDWFDTFYQACCGKTAKDLLGRRKPSGWPPMKVLFPTLATVDASIAGRAGGGTMFCGKAMNSVTRHLFHDANSKRGGVLMHCKMLIAIFESKGQSLNTSLVSHENGKDKAEDGGDGKSGVGGWIYVGSHNFSSAAWGTINKKNEPPTLSIRNYEMGIVFPLPRKDANKVADKVAPYRRPPRPYAANDVPWSQELMPRDE